MEIIHSLALGIVWGFSFILVWSVFFAFFRDKKVDPEKDLQDKRASVMAGLMFTLFVFAIIILIFF